MLNPRLKTRSDYHSYSFTGASTPIIRSRWIKPILWLIFGFMLGVCYQKAVKQNETLALSSVTVAKNIHANTNGSRTVSKA